MQVTIPLAALKAAIRDARNVVGKLGPLPIIKNALLVADAERGQLTLKGTDLELSAIVPMEATIKEAGAITVPFAVLRDIAGRLNDAVTLTLADGKLTLKSGKSKFQLNTLPAVEFPDIEHPDGEPVFTIAGSVLVEAFDTVLYATAKGDAMQAQQQGVHVRCEPDRRLLVEATDGYRVGRWIAPPPEGARGLDVVIPKRTAMEVKGIIEATGAELVEVYSPSSTKQGSGVAFVIGDRVVLTRTIDGQFPPIDQVMPTMFAMQVSAVRRELTDAIERAMVMAQADENRIIKLTFADDELTVYATDGERGHATDALGIKWESGYPGSPFVIFCKGGYMIEAAGAFPGELIAINFNGALSPFVLTDPNGAEPSALVMPVNRQE